MVKGPRRSRPAARVAIANTVCHWGTMRRATRRLTQLYDDALAYHGLKITQRSILQRIADVGAPSVSELADSLALDRSAMTRNLAPLERAGWIKALMNPKDRRSRHLTLTAAGQGKLNESVNAWRVAHKSFEHIFGKAAAAQLRDQLTRVASDDFVRAFQSHARGRGPI
jgi:DNA-binding MarR family transcriptional regulator